MDPDHPEAVKLLAEQGSVLTLADTEALAERFKAVLVSFMSETLHVRYEKCICPCNCDANRVPRVVAEALSSEQEVFVYLREYTFAKNYFQVKFIDGEISQVIYHGNKASSTGAVTNLQALIKHMSECDAVVTVKGNERLILKLFDKLASLDCLTFVPVAETRLDHKFQKGEIVYQIRDEPKVHENKL